MGYWERQCGIRLLHINYLKLLAVLLALRRFLPILKGPHVMMVRSDNRMLVVYIRQGETWSLSLLNLVLHCVHFLFAESVGLVPERLTLTVRGLPSNMTMTTQSARATSMRGLNTYI